MRIKKKSNKKQLFIPLVLIALVGVGLLSYFLFINNKAENTQSNSPAAKQEERANNKESSSSKKPEGSTTNSSQSTTQSSAVEKEKNTQPAYEGGNVNNNETLSGVINYSAVAGSNLIVRTTINQTLGSGTCQLVISNGVKSVTKSAEIAPNPSSSTCKGFDIPVSELGSGNWDISIKVTSGARTGTLTGRATI